MSESILKTLRDEHRRVEGLIVQIENSTDIAQKKDLYLQMRSELMLHMEGEEKTIYAHLLEDVHDEEAEEVAQSAESQHREMRELLSKIDNIGIESDEWDSTFRKFTRCFHKHIEEEEVSLFAEAKGDFSREELIDFGDEFAEVKQHLIQ
jgi:iron-sulfur cluster repair protein YtfE (RIC family)